MKKNILSLVAAIALAATVITPVNATGLKYLSSEVSSNTADTRTYVNEIVNYNSSKVSSNSNDIKPSGVDGVSVNVVSGDAKDNLFDNGVKPLVKEFVKVSQDRKNGKDNTDKYGIETLRGIHYFDLKGNAAGDVTFKVADSFNDDACTGDCYAVVLHYTGNASDEDGITAQYVKISAAGKVKAHFNSYSPVAIVVTTSESAQKLVNTYSHGVGSDTAAPVMNPMTSTTVAQAVPAQTATVVADSKSTEATALTEVAVSPKTGDLN